MTVYKSKNCTRKWAFQKIGEKSPDIENKNKKIENDKLFINYY